MARSASSSATDTTSVAQARFTVQLPAEVRPMIERITEAQSEAIVRAGGLPMDMSMAQVVTALIKARDYELAGRLASAIATQLDDGQDAPVDISAMDAA